MGSCRDDTGQADDGDETDQHLDDLRDGRARTDRGVRLCTVGRDRTAHRDQRGEADEGRRLLIEPLARGPSSTARVSLMASRRSRSV